MAINPYQPAPGAPPPLLAGRDAELRAIADSIARSSESVAVQPLVFIGQRGIGKTALLHRIAADAASSALIVAVEAAKDTQLSASLRGALERAGQQAAGTPRRLVRAIETALEKLPLQYELPHNLGALALRAPPVAEVEGPLSQALASLSEAARAHGRFLAVLIDEVQDADFQTLRPLITAVHQSASSNQPILFACAGLPGTPALLHRARTYTERWRYFALSLLTTEQAIDAIVLPARNLGVEIDRDAADVLAAESGGYPYFVQEYAKAAWDHHHGKRVTIKDVDAIIAGVRQLLERTFYADRITALTPRELQFVMALAELGAGSQPLRVVADVLGVGSAALGSTRTQLIKKDVIVVPAPGTVEFRIPLTDRYINNHRAELTRRASQSVSGRGTPRRIL